MTIDRLHVIWQTPDDDGTRLVVGELRRESGGYRFTYGVGTADLAEAQRRGFAPLTTFPDLGREYRSPYLFATFAQRLPSPARPDFAAIMKAWDVAEGDDQIAILARSGGRQMTDQSSSPKLVGVEDELRTPLDFRVSGMARRASAGLLSEGQPLALRRHPENEHDACATLMLTFRGEEIGWVPRQYSELVARHLEAGHRVSAVALRRLSLPADPDRWIVRVERAD